MGGFESEAQSSLTGVNYSLFQVIYQTAVDH
jgi:hypothetical protein